MTKAKCIYKMNVMELIENKEMVLDHTLRFELEYKQKEAEILLNTDFKELGLTNEKMRNAYINDKLASTKEALEAYKNALLIVNDLIKFRLTEMEVKTG